MADFIEMKRFDVRVEFMNVIGKDEDDALDRLVRALSTIPGVTDPWAEADVDYIIEDATEVEDAPND